MPARSNFFMVLKSNPKEAAKRILEAYADEGGKMAATLRRLGLHHQSRKCFLAWCEELGIVGEANEIRKRARERRKQKREEGRRVHARTI